MLDTLLGRAGLKAEIEALEEQVDRLEARLEAESERRSTAVSDRQDAEERANRLEDRIADLEGALERAEEGRPPLDFRRLEGLRGDRLRSVLARLESVETGPEEALTAMVGEDVPDAVREALGDHAPLVDRAAPCLVVTDDAGLVCAALRPALPPEPFAAWDEGFALERSWFLPEGRHAIALVRADLFAFGEYDGDERVGFEGWTADVMGAHSKGGFSQTRFERRRDEQVAAHLDRCREALTERDPGRLYLVGDRKATDALADLADRTARVDATGDPEAALEDAVRSFWTARLFAL